MNHSDQLQDQQPQMSATPAPQQEVPGVGISTQQTSAPQMPRKHIQRRDLFFGLVLTGLLLVVLLSATLAYVAYPPLLKQLLAVNKAAATTPTHTPTPTPTPFDPNIGAVLPAHRVVAFYGIPFAEPTGPAYELSAAMPRHLQAQGAAYQKLPRPSCAIGHRSGRQRARWSAWANANLQPPRRPLDHPVLYQLLPAA